MLKRNILTLGIVVIIASIGIPLIVNILMMFNTPITQDDSTVWGAIIGGTISGVITLMGVVMTIQSNFKSLEKDKELEYQKQRLTEAISTLLCPNIHVLILKWNTYFL